MKGSQNQSGNISLVRNLNKHGIIKFLFPFLCSIWFPIVITLMGESLKLADSQGMLTQIGWIITIFVHAMTAAIAVISRQDVMLFKSQDDNFRIYEHLVKSLDDLCDSNYDRILTYVREGKVSLNAMYENTINPIEQLKDITREIKECLSEIVNVGNNDVVVSMAYNFPEFNSEWKWVDDKYVDGGLGIQKLMSSCHSTFYQIANNKADYLFFNDKKVAYQKKCYIYDKKDRNGEVEGSIICMKIPVKINDADVAYIILSISTYGVKICEDSKEEIVGDIISNIILKRFNKRIRIELIYLYANEKANGGRQY